MATTASELALKLAVLGFGNMGEAIVRGLRPSCDSPGKARGIFIYDPNEARRAAGADLPSVTWSTSADDAVSAAEIVLMALKPQAMAGLLAVIAPAVGGKLIVSIAAGITTSYLEAQLGSSRVVRAMPNTPLLAGKGIVALCRGSSASAADLATARSLFPGATLLDVEEHLMDAVTAVSGSGPAYFFAFVEALAAAGQEQGFDAETAYRLAAGTFTGAAALLEQSGASAEELRQRVTSPGGTTEAALKVFAERDLERMVREAVAAATRRGRELSKAANQPARF